MKKKVGKNSETENLEEKVEDVNAPEEMEDDDDEEKEEKEEVTKTSKKITSVEEAEAEIAKLRSEAATKREKLRKVQAEADTLKAEKAAAQKKKDEEDGNHKKIAEDASKELERLKAEMALERKTTRLEKAAAKSGLIDPVLIKLIDMDKVSIDDDGDLVGFDEEIAKLKTSSPTLFQKPGDSGTQGQGGSSEQQKTMKDTGTDKGNPKPNTTGKTSVTELSRSDYEAAKQKAIG